MDAPKKPLSMAPDAIRHRRMHERRRLEKEAAALAAGVPMRGRGRPRKDGTKPSAAQLAALQAESAADAPAPAAVPIHTTKTVNLGGNGAERFAAVPAIQSSDGTFLPLVPSSPSGERVPSDPSGDPSSVSGAPSSGAQPPPGPPPGTITPEEAKLFGAALRQYFEFGTGMMLAKHPEFASGVVQISGTIEDFRKNFAIAATLVGGCGERIALKYNLRIPYLDEAVVVGAIGLATYGLAGKPSKMGAEQISRAQEMQRAAQARNANPATPGAQAAQPSTPPAANGKSASVSPEVASSAATQPINTEAAGGMELD